MDVILGAMACVMQGKLSESTEVDIRKYVTCVLMSTMYLSGCGTGIYALALSPAVSRQLLLFRSGTDIFFALLNCSDYYNKV